jgi:hypothetical protein
MVGAPGIMAGKVGIFANGPGGSGVLARPLAADKDRHPAEIDKDLRSTDVNQLVSATSELLRSTLGPTRGPEAALRLWQPFWLIATLTGPS